MLGPRVFLQCREVSLLELSCCDGRVALSAAAGCDVNPLVTPAWSFRLSEPQLARVTGRDVHTRASLIGLALRPAAAVIGGSEVM
jgi:hypothetical protein